MPNLIFLLEHYGILIVFGIVLVEQLGLPIPAFPILVVAGALSVDGDMNGALVLAAGLTACLLSDLTWFRAGRHFGKRILRLLCRISLSPDYCVSQTEDKFKRWGPKALIVSKFVPGFNTIAAPMSGAMGTPASRFFMYAGLGGLLWCGTGILVGVIFHASVERVLDLLSTMGSTALLVLATLLGLFLLYKYLERRRFRVIALDQRGHGQSATPHDPAAYGRDKQARDVVELMDTWASTASTCSAIPWARGSRPRRR